MTRSPPLHAQPCRVPPRPRCSVRQTRKPGKIPADRLLRRPLGTGTESAGGRRGEPARTAGPSATACHRHDMPESDSGEHPCLKTQTLRCAPARRSAHQNDCFARTTTRPTLLDNSNTTAARSCDDIALGFSNPRSQVLRHLNRIRPAAAHTPATSPTACTPFDRTTSVMFHRGGDHGASVQSP